MPRRKASRKLRVTATYAPDNEESRAVLEWAVNFILSRPDPPESTSEETSRTRH